MLKTRAVPSEIKLLGYLWIIYSFASTLFSATHTIMWLKTLKVPTPPNPEDE